MRYKRQSEFKEKQLEHFAERIKLQDDQISKLDEELLLWQKNFDAITSPKEISMLPAPLLVSKPTSPIIKTSFTSISTQTTNIEIVSEVTSQTISPSLSSELVIVKEELVEKQRIINEMKSKISDLEMTVSMFRTQIGDKQSQINFYEKHILELQTSKKVVEVHAGGAGGDNVNVGTIETSRNNEELLALKVRH